MDLDCCKLVYTVCGKQANSMLNLGMMFIALINNVTQTLVTVCTTHMGLQVEGIGQNGDSCIS